VEPHADLNGAINITVVQNGIADEKPGNPRLQWLECKNAGFRIWALMAGRKVGLQSLKFFQVVMGRSNFIGNVSSGKYHRHMIRMNGSAVGTDQVSLANKK
jgi:hypothetical protein